jgi:hypothetical protein
VARPGLVSIIFEQEGHDSLFLFPVCPVPGDELFLAGFNDTVQFSSNDKMALKDESSRGSCFDIRRALSSNRPTGEIYEELV